MSWEPYDPSWLIQLAQDQLPEERWLPQALAQCTKCRVESRSYIHFVDSNGPEWQFETCLELDSPVEGWIVLDVLKGQRVGGIEFVDKIED